MKRSNDSLAEWTATGLGAGHLPVAPGTWGSLQAMLLAWTVHWAVPGLESTVIAVLAVALGGFGVWAAGRTAARAGDSDPSKVVIDEISGQLLALIWMPMTARYMFFGFVLFRLFDIVKPPPARQSERLPGGWGIMADDWIAGLYAGGALAVLHYWLGWI